MKQNTGKPTKQPLCLNVEFCAFGHSVMSNSLGSHGLQPTRLLCPWDFPGKNTGVGCYSFPLFLKKKDFLMWTILEVFIEFVIILFMFYVLVFLAMRQVGS